MLQDGDEEFDEQAGGEGCDAGAGDSALLVEGRVAEGLGLCVSAIQKRVEV